MSFRNFLFSGACVGRAQSFGLLVLRLVFGLSLLRIGWFKLSDLEGLRAQWKDPTDFLGAEPSMWLLIFAEVACAALVAVGFFTRLAAIPPVIAMGVAAFVAHAAHPWVSADGGPDKLKALLFLGAFLALLFTGPGRFSIDGALTKRAG